MAIIIGGQEGIDGELQILQQGRNKDSLVNKLAYLIRNNEIVLPQ